MYIKEIASNILNRKQKLGFLKVNGEVRTQVI